MVFKGYIKNDVIEMLLSNKGQVDEVRQILSDIESTEHLFSSRTINPYIYINRVDELLEIVNYLNDTNQKLLLVGGIQGSGKSTIVKSVAGSCMEHVLIYWYECSKVTNLDDILLSLCSFFDKKLNKNKSSQKHKSFDSIDERLISYLKQLDREMLVVLDSIESLVSLESTIDDDELKHFFNYLLTHPKIKLVLIGQRLPTSDMDSTSEFIGETRIAGLSEGKSLQLLRDNNVNSSNTMLTELYKYSRGYPWLLLLAANYSVRFNCPVEEILHFMASYEDSFESFLLKSIHQKLPEIESKLLELLSIIRHPVNLPVLNALNSKIGEEEALFENLLNSKLLRKTSKTYHVNNTVRKYVYNLIPDDQKYELHLKLSKFYASEISKKLAERTIRLSRNLLHSEQHYHNETATKYYANKEKLAFMQQNTYTNEPYVYEKDKTYDYAEMIQPVEKKYEKPSSGLEEYSEPVIDNNTSKDFDMSYQLPLDGASQQNKTSEIININGFQLELSEEEKNLIEDKQEQAQEISLDTSEIDETMANISLDDVDETDDFDYSFDDEDTISSFQEEKPTDIDLVESMLFVAQGYAEENKHTTAIERYKEALEICESNGNDDLTTTVLIAMAHSYLILKQYDLSLTCYQKCEELYAKNNSFERMPELLSKIAKVYSECYQHEKALVVYQEVLNSPSKLLSNQVKASVLMGLAEIFDYRHQFGEAINYYQSALRAFIEVNDLLNQAIIYSRIGLIYDDMGKYEKAIDCYEESLKIDRQLGRKQTYAATLSNLAAVCDDVGNRTLALKYYKQSLIIDRELENFEGLYKTLSRLGTIYIEIGKLEEALNSYKEELDVAKTVKDPFWIAMAFLDIGDLHYYMKNYEKAARFFFISQKVIRRSISTDSKEKIERRIKTLLDHVPREKLMQIKSQVQKK